ncbi:MAG: phosphotransferase [Pseudomonadota bacterium]
MAQTPLKDLLPRLQELAEASLSLWNVPLGAEVQLINVSENVTYLVQAGAFKSVLRIHRVGYHSRRAILSELDWLTALGQETEVVTPRVMVGKNGARIQHNITHRLKNARDMVMFEFINGAAPDEAGDLTHHFQELGQIAAHCHNHVLSWEKPNSFERLTWDDAAIFGPDATWGHWSDAPGVTDEIRPLLARLENTVVARLEAFGKSPERFNLIHADMRLANLIVAREGTRLIDFDDCGWGWLLYDLAAALSFIEDHPRVPEFKAAWLRGYSRFRALSASDEAEIDTFIMIRRLALLAWIGSHIEAPEPQALAPTFAINTAKLARQYLAKFGQS